MKSIDSMWLKVLAHRGQHWTLLQNVSRETWNAVQLSRVISHIPDKTDGGDIVSTDELKVVLCYPLHVVADCLIDMLAQTEEQLNDLFQVSGLILCDYSLFFGFCYQSFVMKYSTLGWYPELNL